jgi:phage terminase large subunit
MKKEEQIKSYWERINKLEKRIEELSNKGASHLIEDKKRMSLLQNVKRLGRCRKGAV